MTQFLYLPGGIAGALMVAFVYITVATNAVANHRDQVIGVPLIGPELDAFLRALYGAAGECIVGGNEVEVFQNGDEIFPAMLTAIRESQSTIHFSMYVYWVGVGIYEYQPTMMHAKTVIADGELLLVGSMGSIDPGRNVVWKTED